MFWYCLCFLSLSSTIVFLPFPSVLAFSFCLLHVQPFLPSAFGLLPLSCALTPFFYLLICFVFWYCPAFCLCLQAWFSPLFFRIFFGFNYLNHFSFYHWHFPTTICQSIVFYHCLLLLPSACGFYCYFLPLHSTFTITFHFLVLFHSTAIIFYFSLTFANTIFLIFSWFLGFNYLNHYSDEIYS